MQTSKARTGTSKVPQKKSSATRKTVRQLEIPNSGSDLVSSPNSARKTPKDRSPMAEKKQPNKKIKELESQIVQLQEDLKRVKDQLNSSESLKRKAQQECEEAKKQLLIVSKELEESHQQLLDLSASEEDRLQELRKISQDRDREWQCELEVVQKQHSMDSAALLSAMNEIKKLKIQLERARETEATQTYNVESAYSEIRDLKIELAETLSIVENLKNEVNDCKESESKALELVSKMQMQLESANKTVETLRLDGITATEAYESLVSKLEQSKTQAKSYEELVNKLQADLASAADKNILGQTNEKALAQENEEINHLKSELNSAKSEVGQLKSALDVAQARYHEEYIQNTLQIRCAFENLELAKSESGQREAELYEELRRAKADIEELRGNLLDKESQLLSISQEKEVLDSRIKDNQSSEREPELVLELKTLGDDISELKEKLLDRETQLQNITAENSMLNMEMKELEKNKTADEADSERAVEQEALEKLGWTTEEANESNRGVAQVTEQLDAARVANSELEAELRRLKVQSDQWRKAAEAAASMLSPGNNEKFVERNGLHDSTFNSVTSKVNSPYSEDINDDSLKKKNTNMLKKIGVLWKKNHQ